MFSTGETKIYAKSFIIFLLLRGIKGSGREIPRAWIRVLIVSKAKTAVNVLVETLINPQTELLQILCQHINPKAVLPNGGGGKGSGNRTDICISGADCVSGCWNGAETDFVYPHTHTHTQTTQPGRQRSVRACWDWEIISLNVTPPTTIWWLTSGRFLCNFLSDSKIPVNVFPLRRFDML